MSDSGASLTSASLDAALLPDAVASAQLDSTAEPEPATTYLVDTSHEFESNAAAGVSAMSPDGRTLLGSAQYLGDAQTNFQPRVISVYLPVE